MKLRDVAARIGLKVGCSDIACIWGPPDRDATSSILRCACVGLCFGDVSSVRLELRAMAAVARALLLEVETLRAQAPAVDAAGVVEQGDGTADGE